MFPQLISGYDIIGQENTSRALHGMTPELLWFHQQCTSQGLEVLFFFPAGECLGDGDSTDQNLFDAILLGSRRLDHAFSLYKHPLFINMVKEQKTLAESYSISNEMLRLTASVTSHPLPALLARGVKASLTNDDPGLLGHGTSGLSHEFWQAL